MGMERVSWMRELDLRKCSPGFVDRAGLVPGLRSSAAFFTCLRANLVLSPAAVWSNCNTPFLEPSSTPSRRRARRWPSPHAVEDQTSLVPVDDIPSLTLDTLDDGEKAEGLRLVANSVSEMGPRATSSVVLHPLSLVAMVTSWAVVHRLVYVTDTEKDAARALMLASGLTMLYVATVRLLASGYAALAESIGPDWLRSDSDGGQDVVLGARVGGAVVGALVLRLEGKRSSARAASPRRRGRNQAAGLKGGKGVIRAWTTVSTHRGKGVGGALLAEAVKYTKDRCGRDAQVGFAREHANSVMLMPDMFNKTFRRDEVRAAKALDGAVAQWCDSNKRKKR